MTEFYKPGNYWPDSNCEIGDTFDESTLQGLEVITIKPDDVLIEGSSSSEGEEDDYEGEEEEDDEEEEEYDQGVIIFEDDTILEEDDEEEDLGLVSSSDMSLASPPLIQETHSQDDGGLYQFSPYAPNRIFADELEMLITNVDGNDSDPDVVILPEPTRPPVSDSASRRRMYRKSMSLPMSPINGSSISGGGGHVRERLDSMSFGDFLLSPIKLGGGLLDHDGCVDVPDFDDIAVQDFNLLSFVNNDPEAMVLATPTPIPITPTVFGVTSMAPVPASTLPIPPPMASKAVPESLRKKESKLNRVVRERLEGVKDKLVMVRQEDGSDRDYGHGNGHLAVVKEEVVEKEQRVVKPEGGVKKGGIPAKVSLKPPPTISKGKCLQLLRATHERQENLVKRCGAIDSKKLQLQSNVGKPSKRPQMPSNADPDWSPEEETIISQPPPIPQQTKKPKMAPQPTAPAQTTTTSGHSNLSELKRRFLANVPVIPSAAVAVAKRKAAATIAQPPKVIKTAKVPVISTDHSYCSPVKRTQPLAKLVSLAKGNKTTILIEDTPVPLSVQRAAKKAARVEERVPVVSVVAAVKPEQKSPRTEAVKGKGEQVMKKPIEKPVENNVPKKKKAINLEDYKRLRNGGVAGGGSNSGTVLKRPETSSNCPSNHQETVQNVSGANEANGEEGDNGNAAELSGIKSTDAEMNKKYLDPISEAKNKALRMQERRRAARMKQEEIHLKAPLVPILPLAVMTGLMTEESYLAELKGTAAAKHHKGAKGGKKSQEEEGKRTLDEIMVVSVGCNTATTIRPDYESTAIISKLSQKAPLTSNSLLFSIQDAVIKKTTDPQLFAQESSLSPSTAQCSPGKPEGASEGVPNDDHTGYHHGEDKIIMHLRKDRIRAKTYSIGCQTEITAEFPALQRLPSRAAAERSYRRHRTRSVSTSSVESDRSSASSSSSSSSGSESEFSDRDGGDVSEDEFGRSAKRRRLYSNKSGSRSRSRSISRDNFRERSRSRSPRRRSWDRAERGWSRSRSPSLQQQQPLALQQQHQQQNPYQSMHGRMANGSMNNLNNMHGNHNGRNRMRRNQPSPEERKIVYVGRLEKDCTKEDLRFKFLTYGPVKLVTLHEKTNGTRYGFVTFEEPSHAFNAIESAKNDPRINIYDVGFGGRRAFCGASYADLDNLDSEEQMYGATTPAVSAFTEPEESFESLLQSFKRKVAAVAP